MGPHIPLGHIKFCGGIGDLFPILGVDGQAVNVNIAGAVRGQELAAPIAALNLEGDAAHLSILRHFLQPRAAYRVGLYLDVAAHRFPAVRVVGAKILLAAVTAAPDRYCAFAAHL